MFLLALVALVVVGAYSLLQIQSTQEVLIDKDFPTYINLQKIQAGFETMARQYEDAAVTGESDFRDRAERQFGRLKERLAQHALLPQSTEEHQQLCGVIEAYHDDAAALVQSFLVQNLGALDEQAQAGLSKRSRELNLRREILAENIQQRVANLEIAMGDRLASFIEAERASMLHTILIGIAAASFILVGTGYLSRQIVTPIRALSKAADRVASGNLEEDLGVTISSRDEVGQLARSFEKMLLGLRSTTVSRDYVDSIISNMGGCLLILDAEGNLLSANEATLSLLEFTPEDVRKYALPDLLVLEGGGIREMLRQVTEKGRMQLDSAAFRLRDGRKIPIALVLSFMGEGERARIICVAQDMTQMNQIQHELREARDQAESASRAKAEFLAVMSHEIRTPMNGVIGIAEMLVDMKLDAVQHDLVETILNCGESLLEIINDILDFSKIEVGKLELEEIPFDLQKTIGDVVKLLKFRMQAGVELSVELDPGFPDLVVGDPGRIRQILSNLVSNAGKFTSQGSVRVLASLLSSSAEKLWIKFEVIDTGIGIPKAELGKLFKSFTQVDMSTTRKYGGSGLGLTISKQLVELMGGEIGVLSDEGRGSNFWFKVSFKPAVKIQQLPVRDVELGGHQLLLVDADRERQGPIFEALREWGIGVRLATLGEMSTPQGAEKMRECHGALVFVGKDSQNTQNWLENQRLPAHAGCPLILMMEGGFRGDAALARQQGFVGYLPQSLDEQGLRYCVEQLLRQRTLAPAARSFFTRHDLPQPTAAIEVLVVEDNKVNQMVVSRILKKLGYHHEIVENGRLAVAAMEDRCRDLVLMDMEMPVMNGLEATSAIRSLGGRHAQVPIIALTANVLESDRQHCRESGMTDLLHKPIRIKELHEMLLKYLIRKSEPEDGHEETPSAATEPDRILVVDDNAVNRKLLTMLLKKSGYDCQTAEDGAQSVEAFGAGKVRLILMDLHMPGMDGHQACEIIRGMAKGKDVPVIAVTANVNPADRERCFRSGMDDFIAKPFKKEAILAVVKKYWDGRLEATKA